MAAILRKKSRSRDQEDSNQQNFYGLNTSRHHALGCLLEQLYKLLVPLSLNEKHGLTCFRDLFEIKHTEIFILYISLAINRNFRNLQQLFYNRSGSNKFDTLRSFRFFAILFSWKYRLP